MWRRGEEPFTQGNKMRAIIAITLALASTAALADWQNGYTRKDGTYVPGHIKSAPDQHRYNNYGSQSNGGSQRDEFSAPPAYNKSHPLYNPYGQQ